MFTHWHTAQRPPDAATTSTTIHAYKETSRHVQRPSVQRGKTCCVDRVSGPTEEEPRFAADQPPPGRSVQAPPPPVSNYSVPATAGQLTFFCCHSSFVSYDNLSSRSDITETQVVHGHVCLLASRPPSMPTENIFPLPNQRSTTSDDFFEQRQQQRNVAPCWFDGGMAKVSKLKEDAVSSY